MNMFLSSSRKTLRILGTVGEPINPEAWEWYFQVVGNSTCPIVDTWWQTETGGMMITPVSGFTPMKPGSATKPFLGVEPALLDENGNEIEGEGSGNLVIKSSWPSQNSNSIWRSSKMYRYLLRNVSRLLHNW